MLIKYLYWDLMNSSSRNDYLYAIVRNMPGRLGFEMRKLLMQKRLKSVGSNIRIHMGCRLVNPQNLVVGNNVHFGVDSYLQAGGGISIGDFTEMGPGVKIWSQNHIYDDPDKNIEGAGYELKPVQIGNNVWIGASAFIMPGTIIEDGCVISACSVVGAKVWPMNSIISGNPARKIGERGILRTQSSGAKTGVS